MMRSWTRALHNIFFRSRSRSQSLKRKWTYRHLLLESLETRIVPAPVLSPTATQILPVSLPEMIAAMAA